MLMWLFCFKRETADEMRISDWCSAVCASDLRRVSQATCSSCIVPRAPMASRPERSSKVVTIFTSASFSARLSQIAFSSAASSGFSQSKLAADAVLGKESGPAPAASRRASDIEAAAPERPYWRSEERRGGEEGVGEGRYRWWQY